MKIKKNFLRDILIYADIVLFLICSGSCIGIVYAKYFDIIYVGVAFTILLMMSRKVNRKNTSILFFFLFLYVVSYVINRKYSPNINAYLSYALRMFGTFCVLSSFTRNEFESKYVNTMEVLNVLGLFSFILVLSTGLKHSLNYVGIFPLFGPFNFIKLHERRNSGIFWEPGAYQLFLLYELLILFKNSSWKLPKKRDRAKAIVCIISLLSSKSTTGYLLLGGFFTFFLVINWSSLTVKKRIMSLFPLVALFVGGLLLLFNSSVVQDKLTTNNISYSIRLNDLLSSINILIRQHPLFGFGYESSMVSYLNESSAIYNNSVGIFAQMLSVGVVFVLSFIFFILKNAQKVYHQEKWVLWLILVVMCFTEDFFMYPVFFMWLFLPNMVEKSGL